LTFRIPHRYPPAEFAPPGALYPVDESRETRLFENGVPDATSGRGSCAPFHFSETGFIKELTNADP
jgi:hypothetical protein